MPSPTQGISCKDTAKKNQNDEICTPPVVLPGRLLERRLTTRRLDLEAERAPHARIDRIHGLSDGTVHRDTATKAEFDYYFAEWLKLRPKAYPLAYLAYLAYLASHGETGGISLSYTDSSTDTGRRDWEEVTLDDLCDRIGGRGKGRVLYFGSCEVLKEDTQRLQRFCADTGISALVGYTKTVEWLESAACDLLVLSRLLYILSSEGPNLRATDGQSFRPLADYLSAKHQGFADDLGFKIVTATWASTP